MGEGMRYENDHNSFYKCIKPLNNKIHSNKNIFENQERQFIPLTHAHRRLRQEDSWGLKDNMVQVVRPCCKRGIPFKSPLCMIAQATCPLIRPYYQQDEALTEAPLQTKCYILIAVWWLEGKRETKHRVCLQTLQPLPLDPFYVKSPDW